MTMGRAAVHWLALAAAALAACAEQPATPPQRGEEPFLAEQAVPSQLALVLSSGGLRGLAHVGVLQALEAEGIRPDLIVGSSVGALVGAVYASGRSADELRQLVEAEDFDFGQGWLRVSFERPRQSVHDFVALHLRTQRIERFPTAFAAVATDLQAGCLSVFNVGSAAVAVQASAGLPGVFAATPIDGRPFADGGLTSPVPVHVARALGARRVIAVDVTYPPSESRLDGLVNRLFQVGLVMSHTLAAQEALEADLVIRPQLPPGDDIHLGNRVALMASGAAAVRQALPEIRRLLAEPAPMRPPARPDARRCPTLTAASR